MICCKPHGHACTGLRADNVRGFDARPVHDLRDECREARERILEAGRDLRVSQSWEVGPDQAIFQRHPRNPRIPLRARLVIAVDEHGRRGLAPRLSEPVLAKEQIFSVILRNIPNRYALRKRAARDERRSGYAAGAQYISTGYRDAHVITFSGAKSYRSTTHILSTGRIAGCLIH